VLVQDWQAANLLRSSAIKPVIATIEQSLVIRGLGQLSSRDQSALRKTFATVIG
jgi:mRNA interferase MazF